MVQSLKSNFIFSSDVEKNFVPWLLERVKNNMGHVLLTRVMVDEIIRSVCDKR